jgi:hypothetical protein
MEGGWSPSWVLLLCHCERSSMIQPPGVAPRTHVPLGLNITRRAKQSPISNYLQRSSANRVVSPCALGIASLRRSSGQASLSLTCRPGLSGQPSLSFHCTAAAKALLAMTQTARLNVATLYRETTGRRKVGKGSTFTVRLSTKEAQAPHRESGAVILADNHRKNRDHGILQWER